MKKNLKIFLILFLTVHYFLFPVSSILAADPVDLGPIIGIGPWQVTPGNESALGTAFSSLASTILGFLTALGGLATFLFLVTGALTWITSGGDKAGMEKARSQITNAVIGLVIIVAAWAITYLIGGILGLDIVNPQKIIPKLKPGYVEPKDNQSGQDTPYYKLTPNKNCDYTGEAQDNCLRCYYQGGIWVNNTCRRDIK